MTKLDVAKYYAAVSASMLPHLRGRPINMQRFPDGIDGSSFYEKKVPGHFPDFVRTVEVETAGGPQRQVVVADRRTLVYLAHQVGLTPHTWLSRADALDRPGLLTTFVKTTGSRGYHVVVPLRRTLRFDEAREFARDVARVLVEPRGSPDRVAPAPTAARPNGGHQGLGRARRKLSGLLA